jgi:rhodanese-related sulfurtransferase
MIAANALRGDAPIAQWDSSHLTEGILVDVRETGEFEAGHVPGAINLPLSQLRDRLHELPKDKEILVYCQVGQRAYYATRILRLNGFNASNLTGGYKTWKSYHLM